MSKLVILDTSFISNWMKPYHNSEETERYNNFEELIKHKKVAIALPTPVITELLAGPVKSVSNDVFGKTVRKLPFDYKASIECANLFGGQSGGAKAKIKFDCQIIAIAKAYNIDTIYCDDDQLKKRAESVGIKVIKSQDIALKAQRELFN